MTKTRTRPIGFIFISAPSFGLAAVWVLNFDNLFKVQFTAVWIPQLGTLFLVAEFRVLHFGTLFLFASLQFGFRISAPCFSSL